MTNYGKKINNLAYIDRLNACISYLELAQKYLSFAYDYIPLEDNHTITHALSSEIQSVYDICTLIQKWKDSES